MEYFLITSIHMYCMLYCVWQTRVMIYRFHTTRGQAVTNTSDLVCQCEGSGQSTKSAKFKVTVLLYVMYACLVFFFFFFLHDLSTFHMKQPYLSNCWLEVAWIETTVLENKLQICIYSRTRGKYLCTYSVLLLCEALRKQRNLYYQSKPSYII